MPFQLEDGLNFIGVLRPSRHAYARRIHAVVERIRVRPRRRPSRRLYFTTPELTMPTYHFSLCGQARWYASVDRMVRDGQIDRTGDVFHVDCKLCKKQLEKYLGSFDLSNPDWEV